MSDAGGCFVVCCRSALGLTMELGRIGPEGDSVSPPAVLARRVSAWIRRSAAALLFAALALAVVDGGAAESEQLPRLARGTALCPLPAALRFEFGSWSEPRPGSPHEFFAAVWTRGGSGEGGLDIYAAVTPTTSRINRLCKRIVQRGVSSPRRLGAPFAYRITDSGNAYFVDPSGAVTPGSPHTRSVDPIAARNAIGIAFDCNIAQRVVVHTHPLARQGGQYLSVRTQRSRNLVAVAILRRSGESSFRVSKGCRKD